MTKLARLAFFCIFLNSPSAVAFQQIPLFSNEFTDLTDSDLDDRPLTLGIYFQGKSPRYENEEKLFSLASTKKVITASTALRVLGPEFRFINEFTALYDPSNSTVLSPVFFVSGDPTWANPSYGESLTSRIMVVIRELKRLGVRKVVGEIDIQLLSPAVGSFVRPKNWKPSWLLECYASLPTPVILNGNCAQMVINLDHSFWLTNGVSTPIENLLKLSSQNRVEVLPQLDNWGRVQKYVLRGGISKPTSIYLPVHNNEEWLKNLFIQQLRVNAIQYLKNDQSMADSSNPTSEVYVDLSSMTLKEMIPPFLQESINMVGERLHLEASDDLGTMAAILSDPQEYNNVQFVDGSGLMAANVTSPKTFYRFLSALRDQSFFPIFYSGLPVSGKSGTLKNRMNTPLLNGRVYAKTGTIDHVVNLAGYWTKQDDTLEPFVIFTDSSLIPQSARRLIDDIVDEFARKN
jgi:D-alanyl-D-alanine carboxypeptidase/D-alanyl-D-alanine-endopeptidase (penicillin-binding protein 4)